jgi:hypothetical protein
MGAIVDPLTRGRDPLARANGCGITNNGYNGAMPARLGPQNAKPILGIMIGHPIDEAASTSWVEDSRCAPLDHLACPVVFGSG